MTPEMKKHLEAVVVAIANEQTPEAKAEFSKYLRLKTQSILLGEKDEDEKDEDKEDKKEDKKDDNGEKKEDKKDDDKDDKKAPPFVKKDKKDEDEEKC
jgi:hypothetical protein